MATFWFVVAVCVWLCVVTASFFATLNAIIPISMDGEPRPVLCAALFVLTIVLIAAPFGLMDANAESKPLCLRGHEEYVRRHSPAHMVGKIMVPGSDYTSREWICEERR